MNVSTDATTCFLLNATCDLLNGTTDSVWPLRSWYNVDPFKIDALGLVTLLGAPEVNRHIGKLVRSRYLEYLPLLGGESSGFCRLVFLSLTEDQYGSLMICSSEALACTPIKPLPGSMRRTRAMGIGFITYSNSSQRISSQATSSRTSSQVTNCTTSIRKYTLLT